MTQPRYIPPISSVVLSLAVCLLVLPRGFIDYGQSGDALNNALDSCQLAAHGLPGAIPLIVRWPPGVPALDYLLAPVVPWGGHLAGNLVIFACFVVAIFAFRAAAAGLAERGLLVTMFALTPIILKNAAATQDFVPGLAAILIAYLALLRRRYVLGAVVIGLAIGFRVTNVLFVGPAAIYVWLAETSWSPWRRLRTIGVLGALALLVGLAFYAPFVAYSGLGWRFFVPLPGHGHFNAMGGLYNLAYIFGPLALAVILGVLIHERHRVLASMKEQVANRSATAALALAMILIHTLLALRFTQKIDYFLPAIPFVYLLLGQWLSKRGLVVVAIAIASFSIFSIELKGGVSGKRTLAVRPAWGCVVDDWLTRDETRRMRKGIARLGALRKAVVMTGMAGVLTKGNEALVESSAREISPRLDPNAGLSIHRGITDTIHRVIGSQVFLIGTLSKPDIDVLRADGYDIYMFSEYAPSQIMQLYGYDPYSEGGIKVLEILSPDAFYRTAALGP